MMNGSIGSCTLLISLSFLLGACSAKKEMSAEVTVPEIEAKSPIYQSPERSSLPNATIFRMNGDYADNVAVTLNADGSLLYYPAPTDLTASSSPYPLGDGWYLNRQGIGKGSVFTTYKFEDYRKLAEPPTHEQLLQSVIPDAKVTQFIELPILASDAKNNPELCLQYIPK